MDLDFAKQTYHRGSMEPRKAACDEKCVPPAAVCIQRKQPAATRPHCNGVREEKTTPDAGETTGDPVPQFTAETSRHTLDLAG